MKNLKGILEASWKIAAIIIIAYFAITFNSGGCKPDTIIDVKRDTVTVRDTVTLPGKKIYLKADPVILTEVDSAAIDSLTQMVDSLQLIHHLAQSFEADTTVMFVKHDTTTVALNDTIWVDIYVKANPIEKIIDLKVGIRYSTGTQTITETVTVQEGETFWDAIMGIGEDIVKVTAGVLVGYIIASAGG